MLPTRPGQSSALRKSRLEGSRPSMLPKPRRPGSTDRSSTEARRPSTAGHRSSSADPPRATFGGARLSREASATKSLNQRSRSQQGDRYGQSTITPLRSSHYASRPTVTPRTPTEDRARNWQASLDRALSFVTIKDQRPISNVAWQRAQYARVCGELAARGAAAGVGAPPMVMIKPLTITRFVDIIGALLAPIARDAKLNNDNYVTKLPHLSKRLLYPGTVSKSWLKTVNTLHAFPQALALIAYLLDLVTHIETPVTDDWLYIGKDDLSRLRRDYLDKCWIRFQEPDHKFDDLNEEYLLNLQALLGNDEEKIAELKKVIKKYELCLEDEADAAARAREARLVERRDALLAAVRAERAARATTRANLEAQLAARADLSAALRSVDADLERASAESAQLRAELASQDMCLAERTKLLDEVDYAHRVLDSKRALADQIAKMLHSKETELALWQKKTLSSCVEFKQGLIHLSGQFPDLAQTIDEKDLMSAECAVQVTSVVEALRERATQLAERRAEHARERTALARRRANKLGETRSKITELKLAIAREQEALDDELAKETSEATAWNVQQREMCDRLDVLKKNQEVYSKADSEMEFWEKQNGLWTAKLSEMKEYIVAKEAECERQLVAAKEWRVNKWMDYIRQWNEVLEAKLKSSGKE